MLMDLQGSDKRDYSKGYASLYLRRKKVKNIHTSEEFREIYENLQQEYLDMPDISKKKAQFEINRVFNRVLSLVELCVLKINKAEIIYLDRVNIPNLFKKCHICNNTIPNISADYSHDIFGNIIIRSPMGHPHLCGGAFVKRIKSNKLRNIYLQPNIILYIRWNGKTEFELQKKINDILYEPIISMKL